MSARIVAVRVVAWTLVVVYLACCAVTAQPVGLWPLTAWIGYVVVGAVLLSVRAGSRIGAIMLTMGLYWAVSGLLYLPSVAAAVPPWLELAISAAIPFVWGLASMLLLLFPDDRIRTRTGRLIAAVVGVFILVFVFAQLAAPGPMEFSGRANPLGLAVLADATSFLHSDASFGLVLVPFLSALAELLIRWSRSAGPRRYQFRWFTFGGVITAIVLAAGALTPPPAPLIGSLIALLFNALPIAVLIALTRHGLYEVDRVISRTVAYAIVTLLAIGVYAVVVTSVTWLLPSLPSIGVALATLVAAALFLPVLRWVQRLVDRRFDRERYDADRVAEELGTRLRTSADPASASADLVVAVERALRPASVGLWTNGGRS